MGAYAPAGFCNKKAPKPLFQALVQTFLCTCILLLWESQKRRLEPNILTWCAGFRPFFPQSLPRFYPSDRAAAPIGKSIHLTVPFCVGDSHPVSLYSRRSAKPCSCRPIFICKLIMNLLSDFVNIFTQKTAKTARTEAYRTVLILSTHFRLRAHGAGQNATFEHGISTVLKPVLKMEMWRAHPCSRLFHDRIFHPCAVLF